MKSVLLKKGREKAILQKHHWIFSGAVQTLPDFVPGDILAVRSAGGDLLGHAYFNPASGILGRMISFGEGDPIAAIRQRIRYAAELRRRWLQLSERPVTNACRLINAEGDGLPGLIVDRYADILVVQIGTLGMEKLKPIVLEMLIGEFQPAVVIERSDLPARREEGLEPFEDHLFGNRIEETDIEEYDVRFHVDFRSGQKTGFFLDQREMRAFAGSWARGKSTLDCFCNTGGFGVHLLAGGASSVHFVDSSGPALGLAERNAEQNGGKDRARFTKADVFEFLRRDTDTYDLIILDPPAFAKKKADIVPACRGYKDINRLALMKTKPGGYLLTASCSHFVDRKLFEQVIFQAAVEAGRDVRILSSHRLAPDHPVSVFHPEGNYLKSFFLAVI